MANSLLKVSGIVAFATMFFIADIVLITFPFFTRRFWLMVEKFFRTSRVSLLRFINYSPYHDCVEPLYHNGSPLASLFGSCHLFFHIVVHILKYYRYRNLLHGPSP